MVPVVALGIRVLFFQAILTIKQIFPIQNWSLAPFLGTMSWKHKQTKITRHCLCINSILLISAGSKYPISLNAFYCLNCYKIAVGSEKHLAIFYNLFKILCKNSVTLYNVIITDGIWNTTKAQVIYHLALNLLASNIKRCLHYMYNLCAT